MNSVYSQYADGVYLPEPGKLCLVRYKYGEKYLFTDATMRKDETWLRADGADLAGEVIQWVYRSEILI